MKTSFGNDKVAVQGVDYAADFAGAASGAIDPEDADGARNMVMMVMKVKSDCPGSKVVLAGYSQGAEQVRGALMGLPEEGMVDVGFLFFSSSLLRFSLSITITLSISHLLLAHSHPRNSRISLMHLYTCQAAITFGDPLQKTAFANIDPARTKVNCNQGDQVCNEMFLISAAHLSYGRNGDVEESVAFVKGVLGM